MCVSTLRRRPMATLLLGLRDPVPPGAWMFVSCECCVLSQIDASETGRSLVMGVLLSAGVLHAKHLTYNGIGIRGWTKKERKMYKE
jgi:hypothetical protein